MNETLAQKVGEFCSEVLARVQELNKEGRLIGAREALSREVIQKMKETEVYSELREQILSKVSIRGITEISVNWWLEILTRVVLSESIEKGAENINVDSLIRAVVDDVADNPTQVTITTYISGVKVNIERVKLEEGVWLRKPTNGDLEHLLSSPMPTPDMLTTSGVLEIVTTQKIPIEFLPKSKTYIMLLLLFRKGSVREVATYWRANSIFRFPWGGEAGTTPPPISTPNEEFPFNEEDEGRFMNFAKRLRSRLPIDEKSGELLVSDYRGISIARYQDAVLKNEGAINRISYAIMGLEALFLRPGENAELKLRLSLRVSKFMHIITGDNAVDVFNTLNEAYDIRSKFVHGSTQRKQGTDLMIILDKVLNYLRKSIVVFLSFENKGKNKIIELLDDCILDQSAESELKGLLSDSLELIN